MSNRYFIVSGSRVWYQPGHPSLEAARGVAMDASKAHPHKVFKVLQIVEEYPSQRKAAPKGG